MTRKQAELPKRPEDWIMRMFYGKVAFRVDHFVGLGDRMPGTSGSAVAQGFFGEVPRGLEGKAQPLYYPFVVAKLPGVWLRWPSKLRNARTSTDEWARSEYEAIPRADRDDAHARLLVASARWEHNLYLQGVNALTMVSPVLDQLTRLCQRAGVDSSVMAGYGGHDETQMVTDLWDCSRGRLDFEQLLVRHGYHGPQEGELSSRVWREDQTPLREIVEGYRSLPDDLDPLAAERVRAWERDRLENRLVSALPTAQRMSARLIMACAKKVVPLRGVAKAAFLQSLDVTRAAARRLGVCLAEEGTLEDPSDIFFLTADEVRAGEWAGAAEVIASRRTEYDSFRDVGIPVTFTGLPTPIQIRTCDRPADTTVEGVGASVGVVEGRVVVMDHPGEMEIDPGDILVTAVTDPGWASVMFLAAALVTDVGGMMSHAAVIARELGIPCVVGTKAATQVLRTGDVCRVDGATGQVEVLKQAPASDSERTDSSC